MVADFRLHCQKKERIRDFSKLFLWVDQTHCYPLRDCQLSMPLPVYRSAIYRGEISAKTAFLNFVRGISSPNPARVQMGEDGEIFESRSSAVCVPAQAMPTESSELLLQPCLQDLTP